MRLLVTLVTVLLAVGLQLGWAARVKYGYSSRLRCVLVGVLAALLTGCVTYRAYYDIGLKEVERPAQAKERYGNQKITTIQEQGINKYLFEDEIIKAVWMIPTAYAFSFVLTNKTNHSIKINWDKAAFVDENRVSHRVIKYSSYNNPQFPSVVFRDGTIQDLITSTDSIHYVGGGKYGGWVQYPLFPTSANTAEELRTKTTLYIGKTIEVVLPLQMEDVVNEYIFKFEIKNVEVR